MEPMTLNGKILLQKTDMMHSNMIHDIISLALKKVNGITDIVLFGSYARGEQTKISDIDIAVIMNDSRSPFWLMKEFLDVDEYAVNKYGVIVNFLPFNEKRYNDPMNYALAKNIQKDGVRVC